ncbi:Hsp70 family protein [Nakamurella alba]|uniref:Hsp70 family protein n=1 Tax=Nakamurella alba TaxID=2665158 RepID=UPI002AC348B9|nr:Hsp70 family protein [Nakamurella alba]
MRSDHRSVVFAGTSPSGHAAVDGMTRWATGVQGAHRNLTDRAEHGTMRLLAIDFGTSNTVAALAVDGQAPRTVTFDTSPLLPSAVYVAPDGSVATGREALRQARLDPSRFEPNPKRRIDDGEVLLGDRIVPVVDLLAAVLRTVATEVRRQLGGGLPDEVRLTHPANWGAARQNTLITAARAAGLGANPVLLPEPVAAAAQFTRLPGRTLPPGGAVAVYDLGGGTFDVAVVTRNGDGPGQGEFHVLAEAGLPDLGGLDFDQAILDHVGRGASAVDPGRWQQLLRPADASARRTARALAEDVRAAKETLSRYAQTEVALPDPFTDAHLTRTEFEGLIRPDLVRSIDLLGDTLRTAGVTPDRLTGVFLVGGSSRVPLVAGLIQERLRLTPVALDQPETTVALGALLVPVRRNAQRTVALTEGTPGRPPQPPTGPHARPTGPHTPSGPHSAGPHASGPHSSGTPVVGSRPPGQNDRGTARRRRGLLVGGVGAVVAIAAVLVVLFATGVFSGTGGTATSSTSAPSTSGGSPSSGASSGGTDPSQSAGTSGAGPNGVFTTDEVDFVGASISRLTNCTVLTDGFNSSLPTELSADRVIRCDLPESISDEAGIFYRTLVYVLTAPDADASGYLDRFAELRAVPDDGSDPRDSDETFDTGPGGRVVTAEDMPAFGEAYTGHGNSVLAWTLDGTPLVGLIAVQGATVASEMLGLWDSQYKPRG